MVKFTRSGCRASILSVIVPTRTNAAVTYTTSRQGGRLLVNLRVESGATIITSRAKASSAVGLLVTGYGLAISPDGALTRVR